MPDRAPTRSPPRSFRRHRARGRNLSLALLFFAIVAAYVAWIMLTPRLVAYEMKTALKQVCITKMREHMWQIAEKDLTWPREWERRHRSIVGQLQRNQWEFTLSNGCHAKNCSCVGEVIFERETPWEIVGDFVDLKPYKTTHRTKVDVEYRAHY